MIPLQFIGGGKMAEALLAGLLSDGVRDVSEVRIVETLAARRSYLQDRFDGVEVGAEPASCDGLVLATKPADSLGALADAARAGLRRVMSIAAGIRIGDLQSATGDGVTVIRAMPNTPVLVGAGAAALCAGGNASDRDVAWAVELLEAVGTVEQVPESQMDAVTALSGSGPGYVFLVAEAMVDAGVSAGLSHEVADRLTRQTMMGAAKLLQDPDQSPEQLRAAVTSPGGTTAAGLTVLEDRAVRAAFIEAVAAAKGRSAELS